jgi:serine/threonine-protein kinase RsbW
MTDECWTWNCERSIPNDARAGRRLLDEVLRRLKVERWLPRDIFGVHLAMEEALVNAITHGNRGDPRRRLRIRCRVSPKRIRIEIADEGEGFDPRLVPDPTDPDRLEAPGGRGLMLMRAFMNRVEYNERGNLVVLEKNRGA